MSKRKRLIEQHPFLGKPLIDFLIDVDPSNTKRYLPFLVNLLKTEINKHGLILDPNIRDVLEEFDEHFEAKRIINTDISRFTCIGDFRREAEIARKIKKQKEAEKQIIVLHKVKDHLFIIPLTKEASQIYGKSTKWCTSANKENNFDEYARRGFLVYYIGKKDGEEIKIAYEIDKHNVTCYDAKDIEINQFTVPIPQQVIEKINFLVTKYKNINTYNLTQNPMTVLLDDTAHDVTSLNKRQLQIAYQQAKENGSEEKMKVIMGTFNKKGFKGEITDSPAPPKTRDRHKKDILRDHRDMIRRLMDLEMPDKEQTQYYAYKDLFGDDEDRFAEDKEELPGDSNYPF